jgi:hypothetical protein
VATLATQVYICMCMYGYMYGHIDIYSSLPESVPHRSLGRQIAFILYILKQICVQNNITLATTQAQHNTVAQLH